MKVNLVLLVISGRKRKKGKNKNHTKVKRSTAQKIRKKNKPTAD